MPAQVAADMNMMLNKAVEEGTGRRTIIPGVKTSGKTGTTNAYRDAWFDGYSGNMTAAIWVGNDDYAPTNRMTGGSLPGMIWQQVMAYAHQGIEIKPYPGVAPSQAPAVSRRCAADRDHQGRRLRAAAKSRSRARAPTSWCASRR